MSTQHTPTPWSIGFADGSGKTYITAGDHPARNDSPIVVVSGASDSWGTPQGVQDIDNAAFIVRACNAWNDAVALHARLAELEGAK